ncbi:hypothetical protein [Novipirellula artificiosorum]|uniref:hypothetical protein n=1 Tax=Novipirellula artificiosorum TaxID=2528016 RepID=UPI0018CD42DD|nr:hypothetical protein [Novipirellula artificiosorum]
MISPNASPVEMRVTHLSGQDRSSFVCPTVEELPKLGKTGSLLWVDVHGLGDGSVLQKLAKRFRISPLAMEDLVNVPQRPKSEVFKHQHLVLSSLDDFSIE